MRNGWATHRRRMAAGVAAVVLFGTYQWAGDASFGPQAAPPDPARPVPLGTVENEFAEGVLRDDTFRNDRAYPSDQIPLDALVDAQLDAAELPVITQVGALPTTDSVVADEPLARGADEEEKILNPVAWTKVGTRGVTSYREPGLSFYNGEVPLSGRFVALAAHPSNANIMYAGAASGGVHKTVDGGLSWTPIFDGTYSPGNLPLPQTIGAIEVDPDDANTVYVATGEGSGGLYYGLGVYRSTDAGATWTKISDGRLDHCHIADLHAVDDDNANVDRLVVAVAGQMGGFLSPPTGACTWDGATGSSTGAWYYNNGAWLHTGASTGVTDFAVDPNDPERIYGGDRQYGVVYTADGGASWSTSATPPPITGRVEVATADLGATTRIYAAVESSRFLNGVHTATYNPAAPAAPAFSQVSNPSGICNYPGSSTAQCSYDFDIAVNPQDPNEVFLAGILLGRSTDGGATWNYAGNNVSNINNDAQTHVDNQILEFDASNRLWVGSDGGVQRTPVGAGYANDFTNVTANLDVLQFQAGISVTTDGRLYGGTQDVGTLRHTGGTGWQMFGGGDGGTTMVDPRNENRVYYTYVFGQTYVSEDGGVTETLLPGATTTNCWGQGQSQCRFYPPLALDRQNPDHVYVGARRVLRSTNRLNTAPQVISPQFSGRITTIAPAPSTSGVVYVGTDATPTAPTVQVTTNATDASPTWFTRTTGLPNRVVTDILVDPRDPSHAWLTLSGFQGGGLPGHVFETVDAGANWNDISGDLPDVPVNAIDADFRLATPPLVIATDVGIFASDDNGAGWARLGTGLPAVPSFDVIVNSATNEVIAGTTGRGMWKAAAGCPIPAGDSFATPRVLSGADATDTVDSSCATVEQDEPQHNNSGGSNTRPEASIWWTWTAPSDGSVTVDTTASTVSDTVLAAYTGTTIDGLTQIVSNDDIDSGSANFRSRIDFAVTRGTTYRIVADGWDVFNRGSITLALDADLVPSAPTNVNATSGDRQLAVTWTAAAANGSPVTGYVATATPGGASCTSTGTGCTITGLTNGTTYTVSVVASNANGAGVGATATGTPAAPPPPPPPTPVVVTLQPGRIYESRDVATGTVDGLQQDTGRTTAGEIIEIDVAGRAGVPADAEAGLFNITAIRPDLGGFITSFPCGTPQPLTASLNYAAAQIIANGAIIALGDGGRLCIFTSQAMDIVVDVTGYAPAGTALGTGAPARLYESRPGEATADGLQQGTGRVSAGEIVEVDVGGRGDVPADAEAAILNFTAIRPDVGGFITSFPCGSPQPLTASLNYGPGNVIANGATIKLGDDGKVCVFTSQALDLVVDVTGFVPPGTEFTATEPGRVYETRTGQATIDGQQEGVGRTSAGGTIEVEIAGRAGVPTDAVAAVMNITAIRPDFGGFITSFPCGAPQPVTASLNYAPDQIIGNGAIIGLGTNGNVCIFTSQPLDLVVDITGYIGNLN